MSIIGASGIGAALPSLAHAETMIKEFIALWKTTRDYTLETLDAMPADKFDYKPTPVQMNFGKQFTHTGSTNSYLFGVTTNKERVKEPEDTSKESSPAPSSPAPKRADDDDSPANIKVRTRKKKMTRNEKKLQAERRRLRHIEWLSSPKGTPKPLDTDDEEE